LRFGSGALGVTNRQDQKARTDESGGDKGGERYPSSTVVAGGSPRAAGRLIPNRARLGSVQRCRRGRALASGRRGRPNRGLRPHFARRWRAKLVLRGRCRCIATQTSPSGRPDLVMSTVAAARSTVRLRGESIRIVRHGGRKVLGTDRCPDTASVVEGESAALAGRKESVRPHVTARN